MGQRTHKTFPESSTPIRQRAAFSSCCGKVPCTSTGYRGEVGECHITEKLPLNLLGRSWKFVLDLMVLFLLTSSWSIMGWYQSGIYVHMDVNTFAIQHFATDCSGSSPSSPTTTWGSHQRKVDSTVCNWPSEGIRNDSKGQQNVIKNNDWLVVVPCFKKTVKYVDVISQLFRMKNKSYVMLTKTTKTNDMSTFWQPSRLNHLELWEKKRKRTPKKNMILFEFY